MERKLTYFDAGGLSESIRYLLHYGGLKFEDNRIKIVDWPIKELKDSLPFGMMPLYEEGNLKLTQSIAIARYVGHQAGLVPSDPREQAVLDAAVLNLYEVVPKLRPIYLEKDEQKREQIKKQLKEEVINYYFPRFEKQLEENNGHVGGKLTWADFVFVGILEMINIVFGSEIDEEYRYLHALKHKVKSLPGVKEYVASNPSASF